MNEQSIYQFKAKLVVRRFTQQYEINYNKTFILTLQYTFLKALLSIAVFKNYKIK